MALCKAISAGILKALLNIYQCCKNCTERCKRFLKAPLFLYTIFWTALLAAVVTVASVSPELAFTSSLSPFTDFSLPCAQQHVKDIGNSEMRNSFRVPLDKPGDVICVPAQMFKKSNMDFVIPPIFAAIVVGASACFVHAIGLWNI